MKPMWKPCVLLLGLLAFSSAHAADGRARSSVDLQPVKRIGPGWQGDKWGWMSFVAFSPKGDRIASDGAVNPQDRSEDLSIWTFPRGRLVRHLRGQPIAVSPDWAYYATPHDVRRMTDGVPVVFAAAKSYADFAFSPNGRWVAETSARGTQVIDLATRRVMGTIGRRSAFALAWSPRGDALATGHWDAVFLWNAASGKRVSVLHGIGRYVRSLAFRPDGSLLAVGTDGGDLQVRDVRRRTKLWAVDLNANEVSGIAFSPEGQLVAAGAYGVGTVTVVEVRTGRVVAHRKVSDLGAGSVAFSPDGRYLITPSTGGLIRWPYDRGGSVRVFRVVGR